MHIYITFFIAMLAITNPFGNLAIFLSLTEDKSVHEQKRIALSCTLGVIIILVVTIWLGDTIIRIFGISPAAFEVAGALIIILLGLSMLNMHEGSSSKLHSNLHYSKTEHETSQSSNSIAIVPLAIPLIAGPGTMTTIIIHSQNVHSIPNRLILTGITLILSAIIASCLYFAPWFGKLLGKSGIRITTRIMGLVLIAIAFNMFGNGLLKMFPGLG